MTSLPQKTSGLPSLLVCHFKASKYSSMIKKVLFGNGQKKTWNLATEMNIIGNEAMFLWFEIIVPKKATFRKFSEKEQLHIY